MKRVFYAIGLLACCFTGALNAGEVDPEKRGGTANQDQRSGSATGSAATGAAAGPRKEAKGMSLRQMTGIVVQKKGSEIKIKAGASEKTLITDFKTKGIDNAKNGAKVAVRYYEDDGQLRAAEIAPR